MKSLLIAIFSPLKNLSQETIAFLVFILCVCMSFHSSAQSAKALTAANEYLTQNRATLGLNAQDIADINITDAYTDAHNGVTHIYVQQRHNGIDIKNAVLGLHLDKTGKTIFTANKFIGNLNKKANTGTPAIEPAKAVVAAAKSLDLQPVGSLAVLNKSNNKNQSTVFSKGGVSQNDIPARLMYYPSADGALRLVWEVEIYTLDANH